MRNHLIVLITSLMIFGASLQYCCAKGGKCVDVEKGKNPNTYECVTTVYHAKCSKPFGKIPDATDQWCQSRTDLYNFEGNNFVLIKEFNKDEQKAYNQELV